MNSELPRVTFLLLSFNQEAYIKEAIRGAFSQDYRNLEIIISDDCSNDQTWPLICDTAKAYGGIHSLKTRRNDRNLGIAEHLNQAIKDSTGELIVLAAGDDISLPERVSATVSHWLDKQKIPDSIWTAVELIDADGRHIGHWNAGISKYSLIRKLMKMVPEVLGCSHAFTRRSYDFFGEIGADVMYEDRVIAFRSLVLGGLLPIDEPMVMYRLHCQSMSAREVASQRDKLALELSMRKLLVYEEYSREMTLLKRRMNFFRYMMIKIMLFSKVLILSVKIYSNSKIALVFRN